MFPDSCMLLLQGCRDVANQFTYTQCREEYGNTQWPNGINTKQYPICFWFCWSFCVQHIPSLSSKELCCPHLRSHDRIQRNQITPSIDQTAIQPLPSVQIKSIFSLLEAYMSCHAMEKWPRLSSWPIVGNDNIHRILQLFQTCGIPLPCMERTSFELLHLGMGKRWWIMFVNGQWGMTRTWGGYLLLYI